MGFRKRQSRFAYDLAWLTIILAMVAFLGSGIAADSAGRGPEPGPSGEADPAAKARLVSAYGKLPLSFEANRGQSKTQVKFLSRGPGYALYLTKDGAVLALSRGNQKSNVKGQKANVGDSEALTRSPLEGPGLSTQTSAPAILRVKLLEANPRANVVGIDELPGKSNYFIGNDPKKWRTNVPNYGKVKYSGVLPGIDLVYYGNQRQLEYDFVVSPGGDPRNIVLQFETRNSKSGNRQAEIAANGDLVIHTEGGEVRLLKPIVYQDQSAVSSRQSAKSANQESAASGRHFLDGRYLLRAANPKSKIQNPKFEVAFEVARYDRTLPLIIDPVLSYSSYLGGSGLDQGFAVAVDGSGNAYITGQTCSATTSTVPFPTLNPLTQTPPGVNVGASCDVFVAKVNSAGSALVYSTYLGGSGFDQGNAIKVDGANNAHVTGVTNSPSTSAATSFPLSAIRFQATYGGSGDAFVTKLNSDGNGLVYSSYLGGACLDEGLGIALGPPVTVTVPPSPTVYITGDTCSDPFPTTGGAFQTAAPSLGAATDGFVSKFDPAAGTNAASRVYSTYLGGVADDKGNAIAVDSSGIAYIAGETTSSDFPEPTGGATAGAFDTTCGSDGDCDGQLASDAFVTKLNPAGTGTLADPVLVYSTFLGGAASDRALGIALDTANPPNAYVTGVTESLDFPTLATPPPLQPFQPNNAGGFKAFVTKLNSTGTALTYSTYLGGNGFNQGNSIAVDTSGRAYVAGTTGSTDFPLASPVQTFCASCPVSGDAFLAKVNAAGTALVFSTYLGGVGDDSATGTAVDGSANVYVAGSTSSTDFPTASPFQPTNHGGSDVFVAKVSGLLLPVASLNKTGLNFGSLAVGVTSAPESVILTNRGDADLTITSIATSGDFAIATSGTTCSTSSPVAADANCTINVTFTPTGLGTRSGELTITDNAYPLTHVVNLTGGTGVLAVALAPSSLTFADQLVGTTSASQPVTLTNIGTAGLTITNINLSSADFNQTNDCPISPATLAAGLKCTFAVTFRPTATGSRLGEIVVTHDAATSPDSVSLTGSGIAPVSSLDFLTLSFGSQLVGTTSATIKSFTITNIGTAPLHITNINITPPPPGGDFALTSATPCGAFPATVAVAASCTVTVTFTPTASGTRLGAVTITDDSGAATHTDTVSLDGTGTAPVATLSVPSSFGNQLLGTTSAGKSFTITNTGAAPLHITGITVGGDYAQTNDCGTLPATLAASGGFCTFTVTFTPAATGTRLGTVTINDDSGAALHVDTVSLDGTGVAPAVAFAPAAWDFGTQLVGTTSASKSVTLKNSGTSPLTITSIILPSPDFAQTNDCGALLPVTLAPNGTCTLTVTFKPTTTDIRHGGITVTDDAADSPQTLALSGIGIAPAVTFAPPSLTFANQIVGTTSGAQTATLTNSGTSSLTITNITLVGTDFALSSATPCGPLPATLAVGGTCAFTITFTPTTTDIRRGGITITDDAGDSPQTLALSGTGTAPGVSLTPPSVSFPDQLVNTTSAPLSATLQNTGSAPLTVTSIVLASTDYALTSATPCGPLPATLAVGATCTFTITFTPTATDIRRGGITITDNAAGSPHVVTLNGVGTAPAVAFAPDSLSFGNQPVGVASASQTATLKNIGGAPLIISTIALSGDFAQTNTCGALPATLAPSGTCTFTVTFTPSVPDIRRGAITVFDNATGSPHALSLGGFGATPGVTLLPELLTFSPQGVDTTSASQTAALKNIGTAPLTISSITVSGDFALTSATPCGAFPATLAAGATCNLTVTFTPTTTDVRHGAVTITDDALGSPHAVGLSGTGATPFALSTTADTVTIARGVDAATYTISASTTFGFTGDIVLSCSGTESGVCTFSPATIKPGQSSTLTLSGAAQFTGNFLIFTVQGLNGFQAASQTLTLLISDYTVAPTSASATVTAGQPAAYTLNLAAANGFSGTVSLACSGNPVRSTCVISPTTVTLDGVHPASATVTINTTARAEAPPNPGSRLAPPGSGSFDGLRQQMLWLLALMLLAGMVVAGNASARRARLNAVVLAAVLMTALLWAACGGETANVPPGDVGTPAGTYNVTITATSGNAVHTTTLTLKVN